MFTYANTDTNAVAVTIPTSPLVSIETISMTNSEISVLEKCYFDHYNSLVGLARTLVDDIDSAEEVVQHVFMSAASNRAQFKNDDALNYVRIGVVNASRSHLRRRKTQRKHLRAVTHETLQAQPDGSTHGDVALSASSITLRNALVHLPRRQRECVTLAYLEGLTHTEISCTLDISIGSVKQHITRGVATLHSELKDKS